MNNSTATVSFLATQFAKLFTNIAHDIPFDPEWKNGTGYFDHAVDCYVSQGRVVKSICPTSKRRLVLVGTVLGTVVVFERYTPDIGQPFILTWHAPKSLRPFLGEAALNAERLEMIVCHYHLQTNISGYVDRLIDAGVKGRIAQSVNSASRAQNLRDHLNAGGDVSDLTPEPQAYAGVSAEKGVTASVVPKEELSLDTRPMALVGENLNPIFAEVVAAVKAVNGVVQDDHRASTGGTIKLCGMATLDKGDASIPVGLIDDDYFSLNEVYLDKAGVPHVSTRAVAGVVHTPKTHNVTLTQGIANYNKAMKDNRFSCGYINNVTLF